MVQPMRIDENPLFRRAPVPWYDSTLACILVAVAMAAVIFFTLTGVVVTFEQPEYQGYVWVPLVVLTPALLVLLTTIARLLRRHLARYFQDRPL